MLHTGSKGIIFLLGLIVLFGFFSSEFLTTASGQEATSASNPPPQLITDRVLGEPLAVGDYLFWLENTGSDSSLYGYNVVTHQTFLITREPGCKLSIASDGLTLVWVQGPPGDTSGNFSIQGYNLSTRKSFEIIPASPENEYSNVAVAGSNLYYKDATLGHTGLFSRNLINGQEQLISSTGQNPVAGNGIVTWLEQKYLGQYQPAEWSLYFQKQDGSQGATLLSKATGQFEVNIGDSDTISWSALPPADDQRAYLYQLSLGQRKAVSPAMARKPLTKNGKVVWVEVADGPDPGRPALWSARILDVSTNTQTTLVKTGSVRLEPAGFVGASTIAFTVSRDPAKEERALYLVGLEQKEVEFTSAPSQSPSPVPSPAQLNLLGCGQVYHAGYQLYDCNGRWTVNGVQFILPQRGINGQTFWDSNYTATSNDDLNYWLELASRYLGAKTLRIFVDMPLDTLPGPTSPATLYDFAIRANSKGMRLALVLHNDTSWTLTPARQQWLSDLINYFASRGALSLLAYFNADNEINNHCGNSPDCYDNNPTYVSKANQWVSDFTKYVKTRNPSILVTVGLSTEKADGDGQSALYDFFRGSGSAPNLATSVDFLSPHNYGGGGFGIWPTLRYNMGYARPIVLEEYGYPTDHLSTSPYFTEGPLVCRDNPSNSACFNTAPYFTEINARSIRENSSDGFAGGSAWMLVDSSRKDCNSPFDFYTGLFAAGDYPSCGANGTLTTNPGGAKATATRLRFQYTGTTAGVALPPAPPSQLAMSVTAGNQVNLSWRDNSDNETGFRVERKTGINGNWNEIALVGANQIGYQDTPVADGTVYYYRVTAFNSLGNSANSNEVSATTTFPAPTNLSASSFSLIEIALNWVDNSNGESGFRVERKTGAGGNWIQLTTVGANVKTYRDIGLVPNTTYFYRVQAFTPSHISAYSNEANATTRSSADFVVTEADDHGNSAQAGTLSYALANAGTGQTIQIALSGGKTTLTATASLPRMAAGVSLVGNCTANGTPGIVVEGVAASPGVPEGIRLSGNNTVYGLKMRDFSGSAIRTAGSNNRLKCVATSLK